MRLIVIQRMRLFFKSYPKEDVKAIVENASEIHRPVFLAGVEGGGANGCDKDLADYFAIAKSKVNVLDNFDFEKLMDKKCLPDDGRLL